MQKIYFEDAGIVDYKTAWDCQESLLKKIVEEKIQNRNLPLQNHFPARHYLIFCEHPHVYTLGKSGSEDHLLIDAEKLSERKASFYKINRGGDITYHGPGQIVGYPILNLDLFFNDIHKYLRLLEEVVIRTLAEYSIEASRIEKLTGVWLDAHDHDKARKICALGIRCSRWVTTHGFALNINTDLDYFKHIVPCGIAGKKVTSLQKESGVKMDMREVKEKLKRHFALVFNAHLVEEKIIHNNNLKHAPLFF